MKKSICLVVIFILCIILLKPIYATQPIVLHDQDIDCGINLEKYQPIGLMYAVDSQPYLDFSEDYRINKMNNSNFIPQIPFTLLDSISIIYHDLPACVDPTQPDSAWTLNSRNITLMIDGKPFASKYNSGQNLYISSLIMGGQQLVNGMKDIIGVTGTVSRNYYKININGIINDFTADFPDDQKNSKAEELIDDVANGKVFSLSINESYIPNHGAQNGRIKYFNTIIYFDKLLTNCAQIYGSGPIKISSVRGSSTNLSLEEHFTVFSNYLLRDFSRIDPFKSYISNFSFFVDLKKINDLTLPLNRANDFNKDTMNTVYSASSCKDKSPRLMFLYSQRLKSNPPTYTLGYSYFNDKYVVLKPYYDSIQVHETGHAFCDLDDEYILDDTGIIGMHQTNCVTNPSSQYLYNGILYGKTNIAGCSYNKMYYPSPKDENNKEYYRPSARSIMQDYNNMLPVNTPYPPKFNIISCGYCLSAIKGGNPRANWVECANLSTVAN